VFHQVDEEVGGAVEHGEEVGQLGDVLDPVGPLQLTLHIEKIKSKSAESKTHKQSVVDPDLDPWDSVFGPPGYGSVITRTDPDPDPSVIKQK
jgi:hypothetical protein